MLCSDDRQLNTALDHTRRNRIPRQPSRVMDVELVHEILTVLLDCLDADAE